tara:strand:- start:1154 stop:2629 length:1476 start_codon:yes stop_codon:yes gene_type:complete
MREHTINKSIWIANAECPTKAWKAMRQSPKALTEGDQFRMEQGREIGELARELYPDGIMVASPPGANAAEETRRLMGQPLATTLFEATFAYGAYVAKADIIQRDSDGWHVIEVKSSFADTGSIDSLIDDLSYTVTVGKAAGLTVNRASLLLLSRTFRFGSPVQNLFEIVDHTQAVEERLADRPGSFNRVASQLLASDQPEPRLVPACRNCQFFDSECLGMNLEHTVLELPRLHHNKLRQLSELGVVALADLPSDFEITKTQTRVFECAIAGETYVSEGLTDALAEVEWPAYYLDFETVMTVLPLYKGFHCHEQVLTQFSVHQCDSPGDVSAHEEYLADPERDCQREVAERLIEVLGDRGSIFVYSSFEKTRVNKLCRDYPDLERDLKKITSRFVDLLTIVSKHAYHPDFKGSFSIKKVLPAFVKDLSYDDIDVRDGDTAVARFAKMARGEYTPADSARTQSELLKYCGLDTFAMVRLHYRLIQLASESDSS